MDYSTNGNVEYIWEITGAYRLQQYLKIRKKTLTGTIGRRDHMTSFYSRVAAAWLLRAFSAVRTGTFVSYFLVALSSLIH
jgi:hypothetical protein